LNFRITSRLCGRREFGSFLRHFQHFPAHRLFGRLYLGCVCRDGCDMRPGLPAHSAFSISLIEPRLDPAALAAIRGAD
jgi:hypothetical protein